MLKRKMLIVGAAAVALLGVGTGVVLAAGGDDDKPLKGGAYERATKTALEYVGGGSVIETEVGDDGAAYGVEIRNDGKVVEVELDESFNVVGTEADDDANDTDGSGDDD